MPERRRGARRIAEKKCDDRLDYRSARAGEMPARKPPSRTSDWPVMKEARSEQSDKRFGDFHGFTDAADGMEGEIEFNDFG